ncbi:MAG: rhomboid family intramembrane serine protease [Kiritimatiellae bacterium]|nr:rhomboid family intramembrane serine protease [Kiritimatiellia bacterium]
MLPIRDNIPSRRVPFVTYLLMLANVAVFVYELRLSDTDLARMFHCYGVVPIRFTAPLTARYAGCTGGSLLSFVTYMFLHGGWLHIISNMWALWLFGDNVEDRLGHFRFLLFYLACGVLAVIAHVRLVPHNTFPTVGASGAIAGVMGAYFLFFPLARILVMVPILFFPLDFEVPAFFYLLFWIVTQYLSAAAMLRTGAANAGGGVAFWAHVGGFIAGLVLAILWRPRGRQFGTPPRRHGRAA